MAKYLIFRTDRIGDFLLSCILIKSIKRNDSNSHITVLASDKNYNYINSAWPNIYDLDNLNNGKTDFEFVEKNGTKIFYSLSDNLKIVHKNLCAYNKAPCTPTKNYLNQFNIEKNNFGYLTLKLNK